MQDGLVAVMLRAATQRFEYLCFFLWSGFLRLNPIITVLSAQWDSRHGLVDVAASPFPPFFPPVCLPSTTPKRLLGLQLPSSIGYLQMVPFGLFSLLHLKGELNSNGKWCACLIAGVDISGQWVKGGRATEWQEYTDFSLFVLILFCGVHCHTLSCWGTSVSMVCWYKEN